MSYMLFFSTVPNLELGKKIATTLVDQKIAACVNIVPSVISIYEWEHKIEEDNELILIIKSKRELAKKLIEKIKEIHNYEVPECVGIEIKEGSKEYLEWIEKITRI